MNNLCKAIWHKTYQWLFLILPVCVFIMPFTNNYARQVTFNSNSWNDGTSIRQRIVLEPHYSFPHLRSGEFLETVPGVVTTQHHGPGNASQYYLRGQDLNYGTGLHTKLDGIPLSMRHHLMGNGYTNLNIIIPELIESVEYKKGPYSVDQGSDAAAGYVNYSIVEKLDKSLLQLALGENFFFRMVAATSENALGGKFLYAADISGYDGPWRNIEEDEERLVSYFKQSWNQGVNDISFSFIGIRNNWNSPTPIPERSVNDGSIDRLDVVTENDRGKSRLVGVSGEARQTLKDKETRLSAFFYSSETLLLSNNTYYLFNHSSGDQKLQQDLRSVYGLEGEYTVKSDMAGIPIRSSVGVQTQYDNIREARWDQTAGELTLGAISEDKVSVLSAMAFWKNRFKVTDRLHLSANVRYIAYQLDNRSTLSLNSTKTNAQKPGGFFGIDYLLDKKWSTYVNAGKSYTTHHVRDVSYSVDPLTGDLINPNEPFIETVGKEAGLKYKSGDTIFLMSLWQSESDAETIYLAERNTSYTTRSGKRKGIEFNLTFQPVKHVTLKGSASLSDAKYKAIDYSQPDPGDNIIGSPDILWTTAILYDPGLGYFGSLDSKYIGKKPLNESGSLVSDAFSVTNLRFGYRWKHSSVHMDIINLFNQELQETSNLYTSQLENEFAPVRDIHSRVLAPLTYRIFLTHDFL